MRDTIAPGYGMRIPTSALLTRTGIITTKGVGDVVIIDRIRQKTTELSEREIVHAARLDKAIPIVPRPLIKGVTERIDLKRKVVVQLDREEVEYVCSLIPRLLTGDSEEGG
jgi:N-methylhydantoinase A